MERPRHGGEGALGLFDENQHPERTAPPIPECTNGDGPTLRVGADGRPWHEHCEPRDVGLTDPQTSRSAARRARKGSGSPLTQAIYELLKEAGPHGLTDDELCQALPGQPAGSVSKRRLDLYRAGRIETSIAGHTRLTRWGREATVWRVTL